MAKQIDSEKYSKLVIPALLIIAAIYFFIGIGNQLNVYDEAIGITGAWLTKSGLTPIKDFWTLYSPGWFYVLGAIQNLFGESILVSRIATTLITLATGLVLLILTKKIYQTNRFAIAFGIFLAWAGHFTFYSRALPAGVLCILLSAFFIFRFFETKNNIHLIFAGFALGLTAIFRHEMAGYMYGAEFWAVFFSGMPDKTTAFKVRIKHGIINSLLYSAAAVVIFLPFALYFMNQVDLMEIWQTLFVFPFTIFKEARSLPFPNPIFFLNSAFLNAGIGRQIYLFWEAVSFWLPLVVLLYSGYDLYASSRKGTLELNGHIFWKRMLLVNIGLNFYNQAMVRSDAEHIFPAMIIAGILVGRFIDLKALKQPRNSIMALAVLLIVSIPVIKKAQSVKEYFAGAPIESPRAAGIRLPMESAMVYNKVLEVIAKETSAGDYIYSGLTSHDKIYINDAMIYFLANRKPATKYTELHPGMTDQTTTQIDIIQSLKQHNTKLVILKKSIESNENNLSSVSTSVVLLDTYIRRNYQLISIFGDYFIFKKNYVL